MPSATLSAQSTLLPVGAVCQVVDSKTGNTYPATIVSRRWGSSSNPPSASAADIDNVQYYVHRHDQDKRMDGWVDGSSIRPALNIDTKFDSTLHDASTPTKGTNGLTSIEKGKRKAEHDLVNDGSDGSRTPSVSRQQSPALLDRNASHRGRQRTAASSSSDTPALRNIDRVLYGNYDIKTWYHSPYPLDHDEADAPETSASPSASLAGNKRTHSPASNATKRIARKDSTASLGGALSTSARDAPAIKALATSSAAESASPSGRHSSASPSTGTLRGKKDATPTKMLWICDGCFKYMKTYNGFAAHRKFCRNTHPPGRKVYQRGAHIIWEVDGAAQKLYCQNLSLFGKLFIDHKTIYFDVEPFVFYVLTDAATASFDHPLGFFSKEKISYDDYNLACIVTFPPFQRKSFGTLMIEFSYYLSAAQGMLGTPERPLSDLGLKGYLSFWTAVLLRALVGCFDGPLRVASSSTAKQRRLSSAAKPTDTAAGESLDTGAAATKATADAARRKWHMLTQRCKLLGVSIKSISHQAGFAELQQLAAEANAPDAALASTPGAAGSHKRKLRLKGWAGSVPSRTPRQHAQHAQRSNGATDDEATAARRSSRVAANGSEAVHPALDISTLEETACTMAVSVESLSRLTHLRADDIVLALTEAGLVDAPSTPFLPATDDAVTQNAAATDEQAKPNGNPRPAPSLALVLTRDALRDAIARFNVRPAVLDESYVLI
ncbi:related to histone acetyltransferase [Sporisorium reilianum f. sp. reilianum]|uniref:histone acetyltransferase n=1 Tax=Sporisorium reilianum f. sp. reilianum TaxID=72559 RepID=A0A2N8U9C1_9BASI|nr:related to histone acetyltransferase [Sporisorium reilianum f. sp. reilianum]